MNNTPNQNGVTHLRESSIKGNKLVDIKSYKAVPNKSVQIQQEKIEIQLHIAAPSNWQIL